jgi:multidrug efflux pump subunit AcrA (membrane-fusion protein)
VNILNNLYKEKEKMLHINRWLIVVLLLIAGLQLAACNTAETSEAAPEKASVVEPIEGTELNRVLLSQKAAERLDIQTAQVRQEQVDGTQRLVIPYGALIYDLNGDTWVYTRPEPLTFVRAPITVDYIEGDIAVLTDGPTSGTEVVTVGVAELYGADTGIGK